MKKMIRLDLFKLHEDKDHPRGLVVAKGKDLEKNIKILINQIENLGISKSELVKHIRNKLGISITTAERMVYLERKCEYIKRKWFPIAYIKEIIGLSKSNNYYKIQDMIEYIRVGNSASKPIRAVKYLTKTLCKIAGAHTADGTLFDNKQYGILIRIVDHYESNIRAYSRWVSNTFALKMRPYKSKFAKDMWEIGFKNKIIGRYLNRFFGFKYGCKTYDVEEPEIIKNAPLEYRKAFALGFLTFEGGVGIKSQIELCTRSRRIRDDIGEIIEKSGLDAVRMKKPSSTMLWRLWSNKLSKNEANKWLDFFEPRTEKWFKLYEYANGFQGKIESFDDAFHILSHVFPMQPASKSSVTEILTIIRRKRISWRYEIECQTKLKSKWAHSMSHYIRILKALEQEFSRLQPGDELRPANSYFCG